MNVILLPLIDVIYYALDFYKLLLIVSIVLSWLVAFNVINTRNRFVYTVMDVLYRVTEPVLKPIRGVLPNFGAIDLSPIVLFFVIFFVQSMLVQLRLAVAVG